jgi:hypothetical protein
MISDNRGIPMWGKVREPQGCECAKRERGRKKIIALRGQRNISNMILPISMNNDLLGVCVIFNGVKHKIIIIYNCKLHSIDKTTGYRVEKS